MAGHVEKTLPKEPFEPRVFEPEIIEPEIIEPVVLEPVSTACQLIEPELIEPELIMPDLALPIANGPVEILEIASPHRVEDGLFEFSGQPSHSKVNPAIASQSTATTTANYKASSSDPLSILDSHSSPYEQYAAQMLSRQGYQTSGAGHAANSAGEFVLAPTPESGLEVGVRWSLYLMAFGLSASVLATISSSFQVLNVFKSFAPLVGVSIGLLGSVMLSISMLREAGKGILLGGLSVCFFMLLGIGLPWLKSPNIWRELASSTANTATQIDRASEGSLKKNGEKEEKIEFTDSASDQAGSKQLSERSNSKTRPNEKTNIVAKESEPEFKWERQILDDFPCHTEFPGPIETRWGELQIGDKSLPFKEQFCQMDSGIRLAIGGARFDNESLRSIGEADRRLALLEQILLDQSIAQPFRHSVLGEKHPFIELHGQGAQRDKAIRVKILSNESVIVWALVSGRHEDLNTKVSTHFLDSLSSPILKVAANEAPILLAALAQLKQKKPEKDVANENPFESDVETTSRDSTPKPRLSENKIPAPSPTFGSKNSIQSRVDYNRQYMEIKSQINRRWSESMSTARDSMNLVSKVVGEQSQQPWQIIHPNRKPMIGCNHIMSENGVLAAFCPVFDANQPQTILAKDGYAIAGLNLTLLNERIVGFQLKFMKVKGNRFDAKDAYLSEWIGQAPEDGDQVHEVAGDGQPVFGIAYWEQGFDLVALGLVVGKAK